ncbi:MAG: hypothetical protein P1U87_22145 [Verrucomicrobiales bacterium]|nr:hypothetical protein [Verrucomicrobiales bacterium]
MENRNLPRLDPSYYQGLAIVHWIFTIKNRKTGYLNERFFLQFQGIAVHAFSRYQIVCPCICLMPDHIHILALGTSESGSDQQVAIAFLRRHLRQHLSPFEFQRPAFDHVLRDRERSREEFQKTAAYILENPARAGLVDSATDWPFACAIVPGYPDLDPHAANFWDVFWNIYSRKIETS